MVDKDNINADLGTDESDKSTGVHSPRKHSEEEVKEVKEELAQAVHGSQEVLATATTIFPFTLFPDTITIDRSKITITRRMFFSAAEVISIRVEDVLNASANVGPLFGSLHMAIRVISPERPYKINFLWRKDALKLKRILQGYIIALQKEIDCSVLNTKELAKLLDDIGRDDHAGPSE